MRFITDRVLLDTAAATPDRLRLLNLAGGTFLAVVTLSAALNVARDYRQRLVNTRVMLSLRRSLFERLLRLPLSTLWDMKTGGILSRLSGDVDSTTGLLQMAIVSPATSAIRLLIAMTVLFALNWQLALVALAVIPGAVLISFVSAKRVRPIYRSIRKDVERIDGRVGETFSGIRVVRAFGRELREMLEYARGRNSIVRKELFAHRRELLALDVVGLRAVGRQRRDRLVRRPSLHGRQRIDRRHHGVPVVLVPAPEPRLADRELVLGAAARARCDRARVRGARYAAPTSRTSPTRTTRRPSCTRSSFKTSSSSIDPAGPSSATSTSRCAAAPSSRSSAAAARARRR